MSKKEITIKCQISAELDAMIEHIVTHWGFTTKAEFLRFLMINFIKDYGSLVPGKSEFEQHSKEIRKLYNRRERKREYGF